ncbi:MAG: response regulator transcription factor [Candidatus Acidiferrum sp.]
MPKSILIVDDSDLIRRALRRMIEASDQFVVCGEAVNGKEAIDQAAKLRPDLVVLDMSMPEMNGLEAAQVLKKILPTVPLILYTSHADSVVKEQAQAIGFHAVVPKDTGGEVILVHARNLLGVGASQL